MALTDDFTARYSSTRVINLTNPDTPGATANDTTRLAAAAADAQARFENIVKETYDSTDTDHVAYAVRGVEIMLKIYSTHPPQGVTGELERWEKSLEALKMTRHQAAFSVKHKSNYAPSAGERGKPPFDNAHWDDLRIDAPSGGNRTSGDES